MKKILLVGMLLLSVFLFVGCSSQDLENIRKLGLIGNVSEEATPETNSTFKSKMYHEVRVNNSYGFERVKYYSLEEGEFLDDEDFFKIPNDIEPIEMIEKISRIFSAKGSLYTAEILKIINEDGIQIKYIYKIDEANYLEIIYSDLEEFKLIIKATINNVVIYETKYDLNEILGVCIIYDNSNEFASFRGKASYADDALYILIDLTVGDINEVFELDIIFDPCYYGEESEYIEEEFDVEEDYSFLDTYFNDFNDISKYWTFLEDYLFNGYFDTATPDIDYYYYDEYLCTDEDVLYIDDVVLSIAIDEYPTCEDLYNVCPVYGWNDEETLQDNYFFDEYCSTHEGVCFYGD